MKSLLSRLLLLALVLAPVATVQADESKADRDARMQWWRDAKFGMFIHWGVYAVPAGTYKDKQISGIGEWIMRNGEIPVAEYRAYAREFNPVKYDPEAWAEVARQAGMKYIVITSKHHDGFALYPSDVTDWDIADATPYGKDLLTPLAEAAHTRGLKFGTYYSQAQDWTHPGGAKAGRQEGEGWDEAHKGSFDDYLKTIAAPQVREILTRIKPDILWWDTPIWMTDERAKPLAELTTLKPGLITNNRLGGSYAGDTETPEQHIPATGFGDRDWETCMTMNDTWGFKSYDHNWKSTETLIRNLIDIVSKGGNYLLNVGPTAQGEIPPESVERLKAIGVWMDTNGEAIYGTTANPFHKLAWGRSTKKLTADGGTLYFFVFDWPSDGRLVVPGLRTVIKEARLLAGGATVPTQSVADGLELQLPATAPDTIASVVAVTLAGPLEVDRVLPSPGPDGSITLTPAQADIHNSLNAHAALAGRGKNVRISAWNNPESWVSWDLQTAEGGTYRVLATVSASEKGSSLQAELGSSSLTAALEITSGNQPTEVELGTIQVGAAGEHILKLTPVKQGWKGVELYAVRLVKAL